MCTWMTAAPAAWHSLAVVTSSARVTGSAGTADFCDSAPVGATVISVPGPVAGRPVGVWLVMTRRMLLPGPAVQGQGSPARNRPLGPLPARPGAGNTDPSGPAGSGPPRPPPPSPGCRVTPIRADRPDRARSGRRRRHRGAGNTDPSGPTGSG